MKSILTALLVLTSITAMAQGGVNRGQYGTQSNYTQTLMHNTTYAGIAKTKDTLLNADTGFVYIYVGQGLDMSIELTSATLTGTVSSTNAQLYGYNNGGKPLTAAQVAALATGSATNLFPITGNTTYCSTCVGASSTTVPGAFKTYKWMLQKGGGLLFDNYIVRFVQGGTATATCVGNMITQF